MSISLNIFIAFVSHLCYIFEKEDTKEEVIMQKRLPLGYIAIEGGKTPIYAFGDFFLNYTFNKKENWDLRHSCSAKRVA